jgi:ADP-heptose:LPS heptosyltransferase
MATISKNGSQKVRWVNLAGQTSVRELAAVIKACDLFIGEDSAPLHMAAALRKPSVGIIGGSHFGRYVPWGNPEINRFVHVPMDCYGCNWRCPHPRIRCIEEIRVADVKRELEMLSSLILGRR